MAVAWKLLYGSSETATDHAYRHILRGSLPTVRQWSLLPRVLSRQERRTAGALLILVAVVLALAGWRWFERNSVLTPQTNGEFNEAIIGQPTTANPLLAVTEADLTLAQLTHRGLFRANGRGDIEPDLAESYSVDATLSTYRVTLRPALTWSDGMPMTADDVVFTVQALQNPKLMSPYAVTMSDIAAEREDERTVRFTLKEPYVPFPYALTFGVVPAHVWQNIPFERWADAETNLRPVGSGPYAFRSLTRDGQGVVRNYVLEPNPHTHTAVPYLKRITLRFYPDYTSAIDGLRQGAVDGVGGVSRAALAGLSSRRFVTHDLTLPQYTAVFYNPRTSSILKERGIRTGLSYAINRPSLIQEAIGGAAKPATSIFTYGELKVKTAPQGITYDPTRAVQLFETAGFKRTDTNAQFTKGDNALGFTLTVPDHEDLVQTAEALRRQWAEAGVTVTLDIVSADSLAEVIRGHAYEALLMTEILGLDPDPYPFWHSSQAEPGLNVALFQHRDADELLSQARREPDAAKRQELYVAFQNILNEYQPATLLYSATYSYVMARGLSGFSTEVIASPPDRLQSLGSWYRATERHWKNN